MIITYYGISCFKVQNGETVLFIDPFAKESGLTPPRGQATIVLSTNTDPNHSNIDAFAGDPFIITAPGEYEMKGIFIQGISTTNKSNPQKNSCFVIEWDDIVFCHLGNIGKKDFTEDVQEAIGNPDILFVPVGGENSLDAEEAAAVTSKISPRIVIPMHYHTDSVKISLDKPSLFIKEVGDENAKPEEKFVFKKKDLPQEETKLIYLSRT